LINLFSESHAKGTLSALKKKLDKAEILILDEFGYVPYDRTGAQLHSAEPSGLRCVSERTLCRA
jgi:DNA replication protein DnaC